MAWAVAAEGRRSGTARLERGVRRGHGENLTANGADYNTD